MRYRSWVERALDNAVWRSHRVKTDITFAVETGFGFVATSRWNIGGNSTDYVTIQIPSSVTMRLYDRTIALEGGPFNIDLIQVESIDIGDTQFLESCLNCKTARTPEVIVKRGGSNPSGITVREEFYVPSDRGPRSIGVTAKDEFYRIFNQTDDHLLSYRIENLDNSSHVVNLSLVWTEEYPEND